MDSARRTAAGVLALVSLLSTVPLVPAAMSGKALPLVLVGVLAGVSVRTLIQLHSTGSTPPVGGARGS